MEVEVAVVVTTVVGAVTVALAADLFLDHAHVHVAIVPDHTDAVVDAEEVEAIV